MKQNNLNVEEVNKSYEEFMKIRIRIDGNLIDYAEVPNTIRKNLITRIKIISGMAKGADSLAIRYADEHKLTKILFPANWKAYPRIAGFLRNNDMLSIATHLIAFWDGKSSGTKHMIDITQEKGIPT